MANPPSPVSMIQDALTWEQQLEQLPELPARPVLYSSDYPTGDLASQAEAKFRTQLYERERDSRQALSGYLASPWSNRGPQSPAEKAACLEEQDEYRENSQGVTDADQPAPMATDGGGKPFRF